MLDAQKAALQNNIRRRLVAIREHRHLYSVAQLTRNQIGPLPIPSLLLLPTTHRACVCVMK